MPKLSNIPIEEYCPLAPYVERRNGAFQVLQDILIGDAGTVCQHCPLLTECQPSIRQVGNRVYLLTQTDAQENF